MSSKLSLTPASNGLPNLKGYCCSRHLSMAVMRIVSILAIATLAAGANGSEEVRSVLRSFNEIMRKSEPQSFQTFTSEVDYHCSTAARAHASALSH